MHRVKTETTSNTTRNRASRYYTRYESSYGSSDNDDDDHDKNYDGEDELSFQAHFMFGDRQQSDIISNSSSAYSGSDPSSLTNSTIDEEACVEAGFEVFNMEYAQLQLPTMKPLDQNTLRTDQDEEDDDDDEDGNNNGKDENNETILPWYYCCCWSRSCFIRVNIVLFVVAAIFATGLIVGSIIRRDPLTPTNVEVANNEADCNDNDIINNAPTGPPSLFTVMEPTLSNNPPTIILTTPSMPTINSGTPSPVSSPSLPTTIDGPTNNPAPTKAPSSLAFESPSPPPKTPNASPSLPPQNPPMSPPTIAPTTSRPTLSPTLAPTMKPTTTEPTFVQPPPSDITVGVYYYPWHGDDFHRDGGYLREKLHPQPQEPVLGEYDDSDPAVVAQHLAWSRQANIRLWVTSWWGPNTREDTTTKDVILQHKEIGDLKIALHYETLGRVRKSEDYTTQRVLGDMKYICENYFHHDNYFKINGRPVVVLYVSRLLEQKGVLEQTVSDMRYAASTFCGENVYLIGDQVFREPPDRDEIYRPFMTLDAVTNYDVYGNMNSHTHYAGSDVVDRYYNRQVVWQKRSNEQGCHYIPAVTPGYNDRGVRLFKDHIPLSRKLTNNENDQDGSFFAYSLNRAKEIVQEETHNLLLINSFNEWHEDTQIEPTVGESSNLPTDYTEGLTYDGYGTLYLDILRQATTNS